MAKRYQDSFVGEDYSAPANLPRNDKVVEVSKNRTVMPKYVNNGMSTIDKQIDADLSKISSIIDPKSIS